MENGIASSLLYEFLLFTVLGIFGVLLARFFFTVKRDFWKNTALAVAFSWLLSTFLAVVGYGLPYWLAIPLLPILSAVLVYLRNKSLQEREDQEGTALGTVPENNSDSEIATDNYILQEAAAKEHRIKRKKDYLLGGGILILLFLASLYSAGMIGPKVNPEELTGKYQLIEVKGNNEAISGFAVLKLMGADIVLEIDKDGNGSLGFGKSSVVDFKFYPERSLAVIIVDGKETNQGGRFTLKDESLTINNNLFFKKVLD